LIALAHPATATCSYVSRIISMLLPSTALIQNSPDFDQNCYKMAAVGGQKCIQLGRQSAGSAQLWE